MRRIPSRLWALSMASALLQLVPFPLAGPVPLWRRLFCWFCLVPLLLALRGRTRDGQPLSLANAAVLGYVCGFIWFLGNCYWIYQTMYHYGGLPPMAAFGILILFSLYLGLYFGLFGLLFALAQRWFRPGTALALSPFLWVAVELARARVTGFPWDLLGYTQVDNSWLTPLAPLTGVMGISLVVAGVNALWLCRPGPRWHRLGPVAAACLAITSIPGSLRETPPAKVGSAAILLQDNLSVGAEAGGTRESQATLLTSFQALTARPKLAPQLRQIPGSTGQSPLPPDLLAWPEAPTDFADADPQLRTALGAIARLHRAPLVVDAVGAGTQPNLNGRPDEFVSASFFLPDGSYAGRYDKMHLVPFGEYTPYKQVFFFAGHLLDGLNFVPGKQRRLFSVAGRRFGVFICYESIFGDEIREFAHSGAQVLVNLSDDGWYGDTSAPWEHLDMARMRAIENRRWVLRDTNTGLTASIDPDGRIISSLPRHVRDAIEVPYGYRDDMTFYTRHGDWVAWLCVVLATAGLAGGWLQSRYPATGKRSTVD